MVNKKRKVLKVYGRRRDSNNAYRMEVRRRPGMRNRRSPCRRNLHARKRHPDIHYKPHRDLASCSQPDDTSYRIRVIHHFDLKTHASWIGALLVCWNSLEIWHSTCKNWNKPRPKFTFQDTCSFQRFFSASFRVWFEGRLNESRICTNDFKLFLQFLESAKNQKSYQSKRCQMNVIFCKLK